MLSGWKIKISERMEAVGKDSLDVPHIHMVVLFQAVGHEWSILCQDSCRRFLQSEIQFLMPRTFAEDCDPREVDCSAGLLA